MQTKKIMLTNWARGVFENKEDYVVLDVETTGVTKFDQVIQFGILDLDGNVLMDQIVFTAVPTHPKAFEVHGITREQIYKAPRFCNVWADVDRILHGKHAVIYNASFDKRMIAQTCAKNNLPQFVYHTDCLMRKYSDWVGELRRGGRGVKTQKLQGGDHTGVGDCRAALAWLQKMASGYDD